MFPLRDTQPSYSKPVVTVLLIVVNILVFLFEVSLDPYSRNDFIATYPRARSLPLAERAHLHVPPRLLAPRARQHVVPLDLRRQYRGHPGLRQVPAVLPVVRRRRRRRPVPRRSG